MNARPAAPAPGALRPAPLRRTLRIARPAAGRLVVATLLGAAAAAAGIALLATSGWLISRAAQHPSIAALGLAVVGVRFFAISRGLFRYGERLVGHDAAFRLLADLRVTVYQRLERLAPSGLPAFHRGDLLARLVADVDTLQDLLLRVLPPYGIALVVGAATVAVIAWLLPGAGLVLAVTLLAAAVLVPWLTRRLARRTEARQATARGELGIAVVDLVEGAPDLVAYGATRRQLARVAAADNELTTVASATANTAGIGSGLSQLLTGVAVWAALVLGVAAVHEGRLQGVLLAVIVLTPLAAFEIVAGLPGAAQALERVRQSAARIFEVVDAPDPVSEPDAPLCPPQPPATLCVRGLRARYREDGPWALDGIDFELAPGRRIAVIGASGAGKSTLAAVLTRLLAYQAGSVTLAGVEPSLELRPGGRRRPADRRPRRAGRPRVRHLPAGEPPAGPTRGDRGRAPRRTPTGPASSTGWRRCPSASTPPSASMAHGCRAASDSASRWPAPSSPTSRSSSSTNPASTSTRPPPMPSPPTSSRSPKPARRCSSPTASPAWRRWTR